MYARLTGKTPFVIYQGAWNVMNRDFEREIIPMAREEGKTATPFIIQSSTFAIGLALAPWSALAGGKLRTDEEEKRREESAEEGRHGYMGPDWKRNEKEVKMSRALEVVAKEVGTEHITAGLSSSSRHSYTLTIL